MTSMSPSCNTVVLLYYVPTKVTSALSQMRSAACSRRPDAQSRHRSGPGVGVIWRENSVDLVRCALTHPTREKYFKLIYNEIC